MWDAHGKRNWYETLARPGFAATNSMSAGSAGSSWESSKLMYGSDFSSSGIVRFPKLIFHLESPATIFNPIATGVRGGPSLVMHPFVDD